MQPMGDRLGIDCQQLQQFVSSSPWPVEPVRRVLVRKAVGLIGPEAWVIDDTGFKKDGPASPGVARQYLGTLGKIGNCHIAVSVHAVTDAVSCPLNWRLFLSEAWDDTCTASNEAAEQIAARRARAQIPDTVRHRPKWEQSLEMLDELAAWGYQPPLIAAAITSALSARRAAKRTSRSMCVPWQPTHRDRRGRHCRPAQSVPRPCRIARARAHPTAANVHRNRGMPRARPAGPTRQQQHHDLP